MNINLLRSVEMYFEIKFVHNVYISFDIYFSQELRKRIIIYCLSRDNFANFRQCYFEFLLMNELRPERERKREYVIIIWEHNFLITDCYNLLTPTFINNNSGMNIRNVCLILYKTYVATCHVNGLSCITCSNIPTCSFNLSFAFF